MNPAAVIDNEKKETIILLTDFIRSIGIEVEMREIDEETFLPGVYISAGTLVVDENKLLYPGDLLHEAGHIAVMLPEDRKKCMGNVKHTSEDTSIGEELMAIAWSYAAIVKTGIDPAIVFHPEGYKGQSSWFIEQYTSGIYIALPTLQWIGLCYDAKNATEKGVAPYPHMIKWLREESLI